MKYLDCHLSKPVWPLKISLAISALWSSHVRLFDRRKDRSQGKELRFCYFKAFNVHILTYSRSRLRSPTRRRTRKTWSTRPSRSKKIAPIKSAPNTRAGWRSAMSEWRARAKLQKPVWKRSLISITASTTVLAPRSSRSSSSLMPRHLT